MSVAELERTKDSSIREELEEKISELQAQLAECEHDRSQLSKDLEQASNRDGTL
jgi:septal ring factor EnvC (AmiA/AmiB activator)